MLLLLDVIQCNKVLSKHNAIIALLECTMYMYFSGDTVHVYMASIQLSTRAITNKFTFGRRKAQDYELIWAKIFPFSVCIRVNRTVYKTLTASENTITDIYDFLE